MLPEMVHEPKLHMGWEGTSVCYHKGLQINITKASARYHAGRTNAIPTDNDSFLGTNVVDN